MSTCRFITDERYAVFREGGDASVKQFQCYVGNIGDFLVH